jgi:hypothetical protein
MRQLLPLLLALALPVAAAETDDRSQSPLDR